VITDGEPDTCIVFDPACGQDNAVAQAQAAFAEGITTYAIGISADVGEKFLNDLAHAGLGMEVQPPASNNLFCIQQDSRERGLAEPTGFFEEGWREVALGTYGTTGMTYADVLSFQPADGALGDQLSQVVAGTRSCAFEMDDNVIRDEANKGAVQLTLTDGTTQDLVFGDANGWILDPERDDQVVVQGTACTQVQDDDLVQGVKIEVPCEVRIPKAR
jgi:hypothetical protein